MGLIYYASATPGIGEIASTTPFLRLFPQWTWEWLYHGVAFGGLTAITYLAIHLSLPCNWPIAALSALMLSVAYGLGDEWHQSLVSGRSADIHDVGRDAVGGLFIILLGRATAVAGAHLMNRRWETFGRVAGGTLATLEGLTVIWLAALWMLSGPENSFSFNSLRPGDFETALVSRPVSMVAGLPFFGIALWVGLGYSRMLLGHVAALIAPTMSVLTLLVVLVASYVLDAIPDLKAVWIGTWAASSAMWAIGGWLWIGYHASRNRATKAPPHSPHLRVIRR